VVDEILMFSYFKGRGDGLHLACSDDGYHWETLNNDHAFLTPEAGFEKIMRDPCLVYGQDNMFHLVWTCGWTERGIGYASSHDLTYWSPQQYLPVMEHESNTRNSWAPEIFYDAKEAHYMIYWSSTVDGQFATTQPYGDDGYNHRIYYVTTRDFKRFSETKLLYDPDFNVIDANIVSDGDRLLMFMKNETLTPPQKNIRMAVGETPLRFGAPGEPITPNHYWAEGPTAIRIGKEWFVYFDKYKINSIGAVRSSDLVHWTDISHEIVFPKGAQHGYVSRVPRHIVTHLQEIKRK
jgi:hypothetical protein